MTKINRFRSSVLAGIAVTVLVVSSQGQAQTPSATGDSFVGRMTPSVLQERLRMLFRPGSPHQAAMERQKRDIVRMGRSTDLDADSSFQPLPFVSVEQTRSIEDLFEAVLAPPAIPFDQIPLPTFGLPKAFAEDVPIPEARPAIAVAQEKEEAAEPPRRERRRIQRERSARSEVVERRRVVQRREAQRRQQAAVRQQTVVRQPEPEPNFLERIFGPKSPSDAKRPGPAAKPTTPPTR